MTKIDIVALRELHAKATPGEWTYTVNAEGTRWILDSYAAHAIACGAGYEPINLTNATFIAAAHNALPALLDRIEELEGEKNGAYSERDQLVGALSKVFPAWLERHPESDVSWENDWRWIVFVSMPTGQASWHIHDSELPLFDHLSRQSGNSWDGHKTPEKYTRLNALTKKEPT